MIAIPIAQSLFVSNLRTQVSILLPSMDLEIVIAAGAAGLHALADSSEATLLALREAYSNSLNSPYIFALSAACVAAAVVPAMEWKNIKIEAEDRRNRAQENLPAAIEQVQVNGNVTKPE